MNKKDTNHNNTPKRSIRDRVELCSSRDGIKVALQKNGKGSYKTKTLPKMVLHTADVAEVIGTSPEKLERACQLLASLNKRGIDWQIDGWMRGYVTVSSRFLRPHITLQALSGMNAVMKDKGVRPVIGGAEVKFETAREIGEAYHREYAERREKLACVTPDTVVQCPKCGTTFRVGKVLTAAK